MSQKPKQTTIIDGVEYDVSSFIDTHPGGSDLLMLAVNRDASVMFHSYHRNIDKAKSILNKLPKVSGEHKPNPIESKIYVEIRKRVNKYFEDNKLSSRGNTFMFTKSAILMTLVFAVYYLCIFKEMFILAPFFGILLATIGLTVQHDANHGSFSNIQWLNRLAAFTNELVGGSALMWRHQHDIGHHALPNDVEVDPDTFSNFPIVRYNPQLPIKPHNKYQHIYGPMLYTLLGISYPIGDIQSFFAGKYIDIPLQPLRFIDTFLFFLGKFIHYFFMLVLPFYFFGLKTTLLFFFSLQFVGSFYLASLFAVSHNNSVCDYNVEKDSSKEWAEIQILTSANWSVGSTMWMILSGGLNYQIEHHLFPGICHVHYPAISKIVKAVCFENKIKYNSFPTFTSLFIDHILTLKRLGTWKQGKVEK